MPKASMCVILSFWEDVPSGTALIFVEDKDRQNMIGVARSANDALTARHILDTPGIIRTAHAVIANLEVPLEAVMAAALEAEKAAIPFILNPAPVPSASVPKPLWKSVAIATPNEHEVLGLTGKPTRESGAQQLIDWGCRGVVVTRGALSASIHLPAADPIHVPATKVDPVDTVGGGGLLHRIAGGGFGLGSGSGERGVPGRGSRLPLRHPGGRTSGHAPPPRDHPPQRVSRDPTPPTPVQTAHAFTVVREAIARWSIFSNSTHAPMP
jgi:hypothetical protein